MPCHAPLGARSHEGLGRENVMRKNQDFKDEATGDVHQYIAGVIADAIATVADLGVRIPKGAA
eukprot:2992989-Prymnesium_polylepis.1